MKKIIRNIIVAIFMICTFLYIEPSCLNIITTTTYGKETQPCLKNISLSKGNDIHFMKHTYSYILDVKEKTDQLFVKVKPDDPLDEIKINGQEITEKDGYRKEIVLDKGKNKIEIEVGNKESEAKTVYTVYIYRGGENTVYLKDINIDNNEIGYYKGNNFYNIELDEGTKDVELKTIPDEGNYSIYVTGNDKKIKITDSITLKFAKSGKYVINIEVADEDTKRIGTYTLNIYVGFSITPDISQAIKTALKPNQWVIVNGRNRYNDAFGNCLKDTWYYDNNYKHYYHFNIRGNMQTGWIDVDGDKFYLNSKGEMQTGWLFYKQKWYFLDHHGKMRTDWIADQGKWYFLRKDGTMATGWIVSKDKWYYLRADGHMETGWMYYGKKWYFLNEHGTMETGWVNYNDEWYYLNTDGTMKYGEWLYYNGNKYYLNSDGTMRHVNNTDINSGWLSDKDEKIYYFNEDGTVTKGIKTINGYTYEFNEDGSLQC